MIKQAHIGVGISGQEGMQAVLSSDFSFAQFRFLQRLLLVHGRWSYLRVAMFLRYFFYKNFAFTLCHFWYGIYCGWSATTLFDQWFILFYNIVYTSTPIINYAWMEQDVNEYYSQMFPKLYYPGPNNLLFNIYYFMLSCCEGIYASVIVFFFMVYGYASFNMQNGSSISQSYQGLGVACATAISIVVNIRCSLEMGHWTVFNVWPALSIAAVFVFQIMMGELLTLFFPEHLEYKDVYYAVWQNANFWWVTLAACVVCCFPILFCRLWIVIMKEPLTYRARVKQFFEKHQPEEYNQLAVNRGAAALHRSRHGSSFAFAQQPGIGGMIERGVYRESAASRAR